MKSDPPLLPPLPMEAGGKRRRPAGCRVEDLTSYGCSRWHSARDGQYRAQQGRRGRRRGQEVQVKGGGKGARCAQEGLGKRGARRGCWRGRRKEMCAAIRCLGIGERG